MKQIKVSTYITMTVVMFVVLIMFQFTSVSKQVFSRTDFNDYASEVKFNKKDQVGEETLMTKSEKHMAIIGDKGHLAVEWSTYQKTPYYVYPSINDVDFDLVNMVLIDPDYLSFPKDLDTLKKLSEKEISIVFSKMPDINMIRAYPQLQKLMGVDRIVFDNHHIETMKLFGGFLFGGETIYENDEEMKVSMDVPYVTLTPGYKVYVVGDINNKNMENEQLPALVWRAHTNKAYVYVINMDVMNDVMGLGFLSAIAYEANDYLLYPIVNANVTIVENYPLLTKENDEKLKKIYGQDSVTLTRDILWPGIATNLKSIDTHITSMMGVRFDYNSGSTLDNELLNFYMHQIELEAGEMGISLDQISKKDILDVLKENLDVLKEDYSNYQLRSVSCIGQSLEDVKKVADSKLAPDLRTILTSANNDSYLLSYINDKVLQIKPTWDGFNYTLEDDFRLKGLFTALGMNDTVVDMQRVYYPENETDDWKYLTKDWAKYGTTHLKPFKAFADVQLSVQDERIRQFLALNYKQEVSGNTIKVNVENLNKECFFVLRTHGKDIASIKNAKYQEIEKNAYLITAQSNEIEIQLKDSD